MMRRPKAQPGIMRIMMRRPKAQPAGLLDCWMGCWRTGRRNERAGQGGKLRSWGQLTVVVGAVRQIESPVSQHADHEERGSPACLTGLAV